MDRTAALQDRADASKYIDDYVSGMPAAEKQHLIQARDHFLRALEDFEPSANVAPLLKGRLYSRKCAEERYLFDFGIPMLIEKPLEIIGNVLPRTGGFRGFILNALGLIEVDRKIEFRLKQTDPNAHTYKWKVKNDDASPQPRGEITDHTTRNDPEHSKYAGTHHIECFGIRDGVCVSRGRQNVVLKSPFARSA